MRYLAMLTIICLLLLALVGPYLSPYTYREQSLIRANQPPSSQHILGTDHLGRDLLTRMIYGARISFAIALVISIINITLGVALGAIAGYWGGWPDKIIMGLVEILYGVPSLLYIILFMVLLGPGLLNMLLAMGLTSWLAMARIVRGQILTLKEREFVLAAKAVGLGDWRILFNHILPNCRGTIMVTMILQIPLAIYTEAFLSFIGLGIPAPQASWGSLIALGLPGLRSYPWQVVFPGLAISLSILSFNLLAQQFMDPQYKRKFNLRRNFH